MYKSQLSGTAGEVARRNLVSERLSDLSDAEGNFLSGSSLYVLEVYKDTLGRLRTEIYGILRVLGYTLEGFEHQVELTDIGKVMLSAGRTGDVVLVNISLHLLLAPGVHRTLDLDAVFLIVILDQLVGAETLLTACLLYTSRCV